MHRVVPDRIALNPPHPGKSIKLPPYLPSFMSSNQNQNTISSNAGSVAAIADSVVKAIEKQLPSSQEEQGDDKLNQARELVSPKVQSIAEETDVRVIEEKITL